MNQRVKHTEKLLPIDKLKKLELVVNLLQQCYHLIIIPPSLEVRERSTERFGNFSFS